MTQNPLLSMLREYGHPSEYAHEALFQLCRLWTEHQSPNTGTCPVDYHDPNGPAEFIVAEMVGEDEMYWTFVLTIWEDQNLFPDLDTEHPFVSGALDAWSKGDVPQGYDPDAAFALIRIATVTLDRYVDMLNRLEDSE